MGELGKLMIAAATVLLALEGVAVLPLRVRAILLAYLAVVTPGALLIAHNVTVLGTPLAVSYQVMAPGSYDLGFGLRGVRWLNEKGAWMPGTYDFGPLIATRDLIRRIVGLNTTFVSIGLLAPITATALAAGL